MPRIAFASEPIFEKPASRFRKTSKPTEVPCSARWLSNSITTTTSR